MKTNMIVNDSTLSQATSLKLAVFGTARHVSRVDSANRRARRERRLQNRRSGQVALITALAFVALCGFCGMAVDYGVLTNDANRMQRAADAGALAGVMELKKTGDATYDNDMAKFMAAKVANQNGAPDVRAADITVESDTKITVPTSINRTLFFARVLGQSAKSISRRAVAIVRNAATASTTGDGRVAPIGITTETYQAYKNDWQNRVSGAAITRQITVIRQNKTIFGLNDAVLFDLRDTPSKSGVKMADQLTGATLPPEVTYLNPGSACPPRASDCETTLNASLNSEGKKFEGALGTVFNQATGAPWYDGVSASNAATITGTKSLDAVNGTIDRSNPRVITMIVTPSTTAPTNGVFDTPVQGYAPVYVQSVEEVPVGTAIELRFTVVFLPPMSASDGTSGSDGTQALSGLRVSSLID